MLGRRVYQRNAWWCGTPATLGSFPFLFVCFLPYSECDARVSMMPHALPTKRGRASVAVPGVSGGRAA